MFELQRRHRGIEVGCVLFAMPVTDVLYGQRHVTCAIKVLFICHCSAFLAVLLMAWDVLASRYVFAEPECLVR